MFYLYLKSRRIISTALINRVPRNRLAFGAAFALGLTQISSAFTLDPSLYFAERFVAGLSAGGLAAVLASTIALARVPERLTAFIYLIDALLASVLYLALPAVIARFELAGAYALLGGVTIMISPVFLLLPALYRRAANALPCGEYWRCALARHSPGQHDAQPIKWRRSACFGRDTGLCAAVHRY